MSHEHKYYAFASSSGGLLHYQEAIVNDIWTQSILLPHWTREVQVQI